MKNHLECLIIISAFLCSCNSNQNNKKIVEVGDFDSTAVAQDTGTQKNIESSYEYYKPLSISENLVYDIQGYGGPASAGEYAIIRRATGNKPDTVAHGAREGIIVNAFSADLNKNGEEEIYVITQNTGGSSYGNVLAFEFDKNGKAKQIEFSKQPKEQATGEYRGHDSIYIENNFLVRAFPLFKKDDPACCPGGGKMKTYYVLGKNIFVLAKTEKAK